MAFDMCACVGIFLAHSVSDEAGVAVLIMSECPQGALSLCPMTVSICRHEAERGLWPYIEAEGKEGKTTVALGQFLRLADSGQDDEARDCGADQEDLKSCWKGNRETIG